MKVAGILACILLISPVFLSAQQAPAANAATEDCSGMYSFLREGEFVQITVEDAGQVTGFVSRYGDSDSDRGAFLDQFFKQGKLDGKKLTFTTDTVHGVWYEFKGEVERVERKKFGEEGAFVLKGDLTETRSDANGKISTKSRQVTFTSFPQDLDAAPNRPTK